MLYPNSKKKYIFLILFFNISAIVSQSGDYYNVDDIISNYEIPEFSEQLPTADGWKEYCEANIDTKECELYKEMKENGDLNTDYGDYQDYFDAYNDTNSTTDNNEETTNEETNNEETNNEETNEYSTSIFRLYPLIDKPITSHDLFFDDLTDYIYYRKHSTEANYSYCSEIECNEDNKDVFFTQVFNDIKGILDQAFTTVDSNIV